jgi:Zn-dependent peptidase ImmA (M78 family)/DNA-binding XRE family transcriptional regulator
MFNPVRLTLARKRRGLTKIRLAAACGLQSRTITAYESGEFEPSPETLMSLAGALGFPVEFFEGESLHEPSPESASFRSMARMTAGQRDAALAAGALAMLIHDWISERFRLPEPDLLDLRMEDPEAAAMMLRQHWGIGERPIRNVTHLLEAKGIRVFSLAEDAVEVDAFSHWRGDIPFVFLNTQKSAEHSRFDAAHELGHLVLHRHGAPKGKDIEQQANAFASAFLMPKGSLLALAPRVPTLNHLIQLKTNWIVSVAALAYRMHSLGLMTKWHYQNLCIEISTRGYRKQEPAPARRETSQILAKVFTSLRSEGITKFDLARDLNIGADEIEKALFGLVTTSIEGGTMQPLRPSKPTLRLVR